MASIEVYRGAGDRPGTPIVAPLLADTALLGRGRAEMDRNAQALEQIDLDAVFRAGLRPGQLCEVNDPTQRLARRAKLVGVALRFGGGTLECRLSLEEPKA